MRATYSSSDVGASGDLDVVNRSSLARRALLSVCLVLLFGVMLFGVML